VVGSGLGDEGYFTMATILKQHGCLFESIIDIFFFDGARVAFLLEKDTKKVHLFET
jgi:hypothetical protein